MPTIIQITFPGGRYHATPWGRHVNEGVAEWPPSPWRLLRALIAVWRRTLPDVASEQIHSLLAQLAEPPVFHLPRHRIAHSRHYMPWEKKGPFDRTLVFDTFVSIDRETPLLIGWLDGQLSSEHRQLLDALLNNLAWLGRGESWVVSRTTDQTGEWNCVPDLYDTNPVQVLCADAATCFSGTHYPIQLARGKVNPANWNFDCPAWQLCLDTEFIRAQRWPYAPGSRWVNYQRPSEVTGKARSAPSFVIRSSMDKPTLATFLVDGAVLPLMTEALVVTESLRRAVMSQFGRWCRRNPQLAERFRRQDDPESFASPVLSGRTLDGQCLNGHRHARYLALPLEQDRRRIGSLAIHAEEGFGPAEIAALASLQSVTIRSGRRDSTQDVRLQLTGLSNTPQVGQRFAAESSEWVSVTPFLGNSEIGRMRQVAYLRKGIRREWRRLAELRPDWKDIELIEVVERTPEEIGSQQLPFAREFRRVRGKHGGNDAWRAGGLFRLRFSSAVVGPLSLGYASHFGMGLFVADDTMALQKRIRDTSLESKLPRE